MSCRVDAREAVLRVSPVRGCSTSRGVEQHSSNACELQCGCQRGCPACLARAGLQQKAGARNTTAAVQVSWSEVVTVCPVSLQHRAAGESRGTYSAAAAHVSSGALPGRLFCQHAQANKLTAVAEALGPKGLSAQLLTLVCKGDVPAPGCVVCAIPKRCVLTTSKSIQCAGN